MALEQNIPRQAEGDRIPIRCLVTNADDDSPKDVSGYDVLFTLAESAEDPPEFQYDEGDSNVSITDHDGDGTANAVDVDVLATDTEDLGGNREEGLEYYYEVELTDSGGDPQTVTYGHIPIAESY